MGVLLDPAKELSNDMCSDVDEPKNITLKKARPEKPHRV